MILTAGPSISKKEISYGLDAIKNGWNFHYRDYIEKFQDAFAKYLGKKYAFAVTSGTAALHLAMLALEIGEGDEVILPDQTFISIANAVRWTGATPVFCDIEPDTWCIDPKSFEQAITKKTKAVIAVYTYGQAPKMDEINRIAKNRGIYVIEDACPAIGTFYKKKRAGSLSDISCFSFQGAKIMVTGEGGMIVTSKKKWADTISSLMTHGRDLKKEFWHSDIGFMYRMSNLQAAIGLAQLERSDSFAKKKRKIYSWYKKRLSKIEGLLLNDENAWSEPNYWMVSIILNKKFKLSKEQLRKRLKKDKIDTRPFFYPISSFPFYKDNPKTDTPVSRHARKNGINLPSGVMLEKKHVDYICDRIIKHLT